MSACLYDPALFSFPPTPDSSFFASFASLFFLTSPSPCLFCYPLPRQSSLHPQSQLLFKYLWFLNQISSADHSETLENKISCWTVNEDVWNWHLCWSISKSPHIQIVPNQGHSPHTPTPPLPGPGSSLEFHNDNEWGYLQLSCIS